MEGRDIGTVVFPDAEVKIYLDANADVRAGRRIGDLQQRGQTPAPEDVAKEIAERDQRDRTRAEAPLIQAPDAVYVDTTGLDAAQVEEELLRIVRSRVSNGKEVAR
jgi:cytidylate kinase